MACDRSAFEGRGDPRPTPDSIEFLLDHQSPISVTVNAGFLSNERRIRLFVRGMRKKKPFLPALLLTSFLVG